MVEKVDFEKVASDLETVKTAVEALFKDIDVRSKLAEARKLIVADDPMDIYKDLLSAEFYACMVEPMPTKRIDFFAAVHGVDLDAAIERGKELMPSAMLLTLLQTDFDDGGDGSTAIEGFTVTDKLILESMPKFQALILGGAKAAYDLATAASDRNDLLKYMEDNIRAAQMTAGKVYKA